MSTAAGDPAPRRKPRGRAGNVWIVVFVVLVFAAGMLSSPFGQRLVGLDLDALFGYGDDAEAAAARDAALDEAGRRLSEIEKQIDSLERNLATAGGDIARLEGEIDPGAVQGLTAELDAVRAEARNTQSALAEVRSALGAYGDLAAALDDLGERTESLEVARDRPAPVEQRAPSRLADDQAADLEQRLAALTGRIESLEGADVPSDAGAQLAALEGRLAALERDLPETAAGVRARLDMLETEGAARGPETALVVAIARLRDAAARGPFADALAPVDRLIGDLGDAEMTGLLDALAPAAETGVPGLAGLQSEFSDLAGRAVHAGRIGSQADWIEWTWNRLTSIVSVRRTGDIAGADTEARIARAEIRLARGDLAGALGEIENLSGEAAAVLAPWRQRAELRLSAARALDALSLRALALFGAS